MIDLLLKVARNVARSFGSDDEYESIAYFIVGTQYAYTQGMDQPRALAYLKQCVTNACIDHNRRERVREHDDLLDVEERVPIDCTELYRTLREVLNPLALSVLELKVFGNLTHDEIAQKLSISVYSITAIMKGIRDATRKIQG